MQAGSAFSWLADPELLPSPRERVILEGIERARAKLSLVPIGERWAATTFGRFSAARLKIVDKDGRLVPLHLNWAQRQVYGAELQMRRDRRRPWLLVLKYRKGGISTLQQALAYWTLRKGRYRRCRTLAHRGEDVSQIFSMVERFWQEEPDDGHRPRKTTAGKTHIELPDLGGYYGADTAGSLTGGRGSTYQRIHGAEAAFWRSLKTLHKALAEAQANDCAYVLESTPNGREGDGQDFYEFWQAAKQGKNAFRPIFLPWWADPANRQQLRAPDELGPLDPEEEKRVRLYGIDLDQVKWWRQKRLELAAEGRGMAAIVQEHPDNDEDCFVESGTPYFDADLLAQRRTEQVRPPIRIEEGGALHGLRVYAEPVPGHEYSVGCDPAEGVEGDESAMYVQDHTAHETAAVWNRNDVDPNTLGKVQLRELGLRYRCEDDAPAYLVVERNNHGHAVLGALLDSGYPPARVYHHVHATDPDGNPSSKAGWPNNVATKGVLVSAIGTSLRDGVPVIRDGATHASIRRIERQANGTAELTGRDLAVAYGLSLSGAPQPSALRFRTL